MLDKTGTLFLPYAGAQPAVDSAWIKHYTVSKLPAVIPPLNGGNQQ